MAKHSPGTFDLALTASDRAPIPTVKPSPEDDKVISDAKAFLVARAPFWAHYLYNEMRIEFTEHPGVPIAATDGWTMWFNVPGIRSHNMTIANVAFVIAHEVCHGFLADLVVAVRYRTEGKVLVSGGKYLPYDHDLMNKALDFRINAMLVKGNVGKMPAVGCFDTSISAEGMESAVEIYEKLHKQGGGGGSGRYGNTGGDGNPFDVHLAPADEVVQNEGTGKREQAMAAAAAASEAAGKAMGDLPMALRTLIGEILEPHVPWQDQLKSMMIRAAGDPTWDWRYLDKRLLSRPDPMYFARMAHAGAGTIAILDDTSGSCADMRHQQRFFSEMNGIVNDLNPQRLIVLWCDADIQRIDDLEDVDDLLDLHREIEALGGAPGGGGTDFRPVFKWLEDNDVQPDMLVCLTDTLGTFPDKEPDYPCIWASVYKGHNVPWGQVIDVELD